MCSLLNWTGAIAADMRFTMDTQTLRLISSLPGRRPSSTSPDRLSGLFRVLAHVTDANEAAVAEDGIWSLWMAHQNAGAARALNLATDDIAARRFDIAETRLTRLLRSCPTMQRPGTSARPCITCSGGMRSAAPISQRRCPSSRATSVPWLSSARSASPTATMKQRYSPSMQPCACIPTSVT